MVVHEKEMEEINRMKSKEREKKRKILPLEAKKDLWFLFT